MPSENLLNDTKRLFEFGPFSLEVEERRLLKNGELVPLTAKVFDLLLLLVASPGRLRTRSDLIEALWPDTIVEEHSLTSRISALRKALGDEDDPPRYIETVRGQGYRFVADVTAPQPTTPVAPDKTAAGSPGKRFILVSALAAACTLVAVAIVLFFWHSPRRSTPVNIPSKSIAVLPFENLSTDKNNGYFAEGMQDMILTKLADIGGLKVISRTSADLYKSHPTDLRTIARQLGVATVLEGSIQKSGDQVLVNVQLIDARTDRHIWAKSYTRTLSNIFDVESDVSQRVASQLQLELLPSVAKRIQTAPTQNPEAYDLLLKADHYLAQFFSSGKQKWMETAIDNYKKAITHDPKFALAYAQLSYAFTVSYFYLHQHTPTRLKEARDTADKALALNPDLAQAHVAKGYYYYWGRHDYANALSEFKKALVLKPQDALVRLYIGSVYRRQGHWEMAVKEIREAVSLDPRNTIILRNLALCYSALRRYKKALEIDNRILSITPNAPVDVANLAYIYDYLGQIDKALETLQQLPPEQHKNRYVTYARLQTLTLKHDFKAACKASEDMKAGGQFTAWFVLSLRATALALCGYPDKSRQDNQKLVRQLTTALKKNPDNALMHASLGMAYAQLGEYGKGISEGQRAVDLFPMGKDAFFAPSYLGNLAQIYAQAKKPVQAVELIKKLLQIPAGDEICIPLLKLDPTWDPIRHSPEFQTLFTTQFKIALDTA